MPSTERLYGQLDDADNEMAGIKAKGAALYKEIADKVRAFAEDYDCQPDSTLEYIEGAIADLVDDAQGPAWRRKCRLENEIGAIEDADLRLNAPVVL